MPYHPSSHPFIPPLFSVSTNYKLTRSSSMSNLFCFIGALALAFAVADYFFSVFAALIDLFPSLPTLPSSYIYIFSLLFVCAYKLISALPNKFNDDLGGLFFSAFAENISSRIISWLIDHFPSFNSSRGQKKGDQMNGGKLNNNQSSEGQINGDQVNTGHSSGSQMNGGQMCDQNSGGQMNGGQMCDQNSGGQMNGVQMNGGEMYNGKLNCSQRSEGHKNGGQSSGVQLNGVQMNGGKMKNGQFNIKQ